MVCALYVDFDNRGGVHGLIARCIVLTAPVPKTWFCIALVSVPACMQAEQVLL